MNTHLVIGLLLLGLVLPLTSALAEEPAQPTRVLVFSKTAGYRHASIPVGIKTIETLGQEHGFAVEATEDGGSFSAENLARFKAVVFLSTTGDVLDDEQQLAFEGFIGGGGGYVGVHGAADTEYDWPWYGELVGAYFVSHPRIQLAEVRVADRVHPATRGLPARWQRTDEWYNYRANPRGKVHVLATLAESSYEGGDMGYDHPIAWCHDVGNGRAFYTAGGHTDESYAEPLFRSHLLGGILWAARLAEGDAGATVDANFDKVTLDDFVTDPMELAVAPDGRVVFVERGGVIKVWQPSTRRTVIAGFLRVFTGVEDGLLGITLDPDFMKNGWFYVCYAPAGADAKILLSRLTLGGDAIEPGSEKVLLEVATQREECCHSGGSLTFDAAGNLYLSTGDNTSPFASDGYSPIDERPGRAPFDAQKSSGSVGDLRGKILRIRPTADGSYTIPAGNLSAAEGTQGRPEIYVMGCRNPFRIQVDRARGWLYWGEIGPDASEPDAQRGPAGHDELNRAKAAGNFGWPYFVGDNKPYADFDFATRAPGAFFDAAAPRNDSPNRTGNPLLPAAQPAWLWYPYGASPEFPELGTGGRCAMGGPVYHYDRATAGVGSLPAYFDGSVFFYDWARDWVMEIKLDDDGELLAINPFLRGLHFTRPMDMEIGADGCLYMIEWGSGFGGGNPDAQVVKIEYYPNGDRPPVARAEANPSSGRLPLAVAFSSEGSASRGMEPGLQFAWDFDGDGKIDSREASPKHEFARAGSFNAQLVVTDRLGKTAVANMPIAAGNTRPQVEILWPPAGGFFAFGDWVEFKVRAQDAEDGVAPGEAVTVQPFLGHDTHAHPLHAQAALAGKIQTLADDGHGGDADLFTVIAATTTDHGAPGVAPLSGRAEVVLQPKRKQAEHHGSSSNVRIEKADDAAGGGEAVVFAADGAHTSYHPVSFHGITGVTARVATSTGGTLELRLDAPDGTLLGRAEVEAGGSIQLAAGAHPVRVEFFEAGAGAGLIWRVRGGGLDGAPVPAAWLSHGEGKPGLEARFYELESPTQLPRFDDLYCVGTATVAELSASSTDGALFGSPRTDNFGIVFTGFLNIAKAGAYSFSLESDDGSRLIFDDKLLIDNDGQHAMRERATGSNWEHVELPLTDPGGTHTLFVVHRVRASVKNGTLKLNWLEFQGEGVATTPPADAPPTKSDHDHDHDHHDHEHPR